MSKWRLEAQGSRAPRGEYASRSSANSRNRESTKNLIRTMNTHFRAHNCNSRERIIEAQPIAAEVAQGRGQVDGRRVLGELFSRLQQRQAVLRAKLGDFDAGDGGHIIEFEHK